MPDIFVSYAAEDRERVEPLVARLEAEGWSVWWDRQIGAGSTFDREIEVALDDARAVIVVWSRHSVDSDWVRTEAHEGLDRDILVPVRIEDVRPPLAFRRKQMIDLLVPGDGGLDTVVDAVRRLLATSLEFGLAPEPAPAPSDRSIAILAFQDMGPGNEHEYLGDSIAEDLMNALAQIPDLRVAARTDAFRFKRSSTRTQDIGRELNVKHVLEGSVRVAGKRLRITAQLIDASSGYHEWSNSYDGTLDDIFDVQDDVSRRVADALKVVLNPEEHERMLGAGTTNVDAYLAYAQSVGTDLGGMARVVELCDEALRHDPDFVAACARKLSVLAVLGQAQEVPLATVREEQQMIHLRLQEIQRTGRRRASPYDVASIHVNTWSWADLESTLREMIESGRHQEPDPLGRGWPVADYARLLLMSSAYRTSMAYYEPIACAPMSEFGLTGPLNFNLAWCHMGLGELEQALEIQAPGVDRLLAAGNRPWAPLATTTLCHIFLDDFDSAERRIQELRAMQQDSRARYMETLVLIRKGETDAARAQLDALEQESPRLRLYLGLINHWLGRHERGYEWWAAAMREREYILNQLRFVVEGLIPESVRTSDEYQKVLEIGGLDDTWKRELLARAAKLTPITGVEVRD